MPKGVYKRTPEMNAANSKRQKGVPHTSKAQLAADEAKTGVPHPPEHNAAISKAKTGVPNSPKHNAAIKNSDAHKTNADKMRGGNDLVTHHHIYDHDDLSKYTIKMTRFQHGKLHNNMQLLGLKVPHINTWHENEDELKLMEYIKKVESDPKGL